MCFQSTVEISMYHIFYVNYLDVPYNVCYLLFYYRHIHNVSDFSESDLILIEKKNKHILCG